MPFCEIAYFDVESLGFGLETGHEGCGFDCCFEKVDGVAFEAEHAGVS